MVAVPGWGYRWVVEPGAFGIDAWVFAFVDLLVPWHERLVLLPPPEDVEEDEQDEDDAGGNASGNAGDGGVGAAGVGVGGLRGD